MQKGISDAPDASGGGAGFAFGGVVLMTVAGLFVARAGGSDRETFLAIGFMIGAVGLLGIVIGGVAIGVRMARDEHVRPTSWRR